MPLSEPKPSSPFGQKSPLQAAISLSDSITRSADYHNLKLVILEKGFTDIPTSKKSDGIRYGIHKAFSMIEELSAKAKTTEKSQDEKDPDLYLPE